MKLRPRSLARLATLGLTGLALAGHGAAPRPSAQACGACVCADDEGRFVVHPGTLAPRNARVFVGGPGVMPDSVHLRAHDSPEPVPTVAELAGPAVHHGVWIVPDEMLAPNERYDVVLGGEREPIGSFETGEHVDDQPPEIASMRVDPLGGSLREVCGEKIFG